MTQRKEFQRLLESKKLKQTSQRALIWGILRESKGHPSVEQIRGQLLAKGHKIGVATIYRTLRILLASGLIRQSRLGGMTSYVDVIRWTKHIHFFSYDYVVYF